MTHSDSDVVLAVENLQTHLYTKRGLVRAVDGVSFDLRSGETLGIVGESGSGKSMTALSLVRLIPRPAARIVGGSVRLDGEEILEKSEAEMRAIRGEQIAMILQDPQSSLNPVFTVGDQIAETFQLQGKQPRGRMRERAIAALREVQVADPENRVSNFPHEMSGGMKQRVVGAIAVARRPRVLIADEPTTSLDVTIQAQYLRLLRSIQQQTGTSIIFITHDFGIVAKMCDRVAVMYAGRIVEYGPVHSIFATPSHPYTQALIASVPSPDTKVERLESIEGQPPVPWDLPKGCRFAPRCPFVMDRCRADYPPMFATQSAGDGDAEAEHAAACRLLEGES